MDLKISQELFSIDKYPLILVFLNLRKAYDTLYGGRLTRTLEVYGAGPQMYELRVAFWAH